MVLVDRFGNLVTSVRAEVVAAAGAGTLVHVAGRELPLVETYGDLPRGAPGALGRLAGTPRSRRSGGARRGPPPGGKGRASAPQAVEFEDEPVDVEGPDDPVDVEVPDELVDVEVEDPDDPDGAGDAAVVDGATAVLDWSLDDFSGEGFVPVPPFSDSRAFLRAADG